MKTTDWTPLLERMRKGEEEAYQTFYTRTRDHTYRILVYLTANAQDVPDLMSDVYAAVLRSLPRYDPDKQRFDAWYSGLIANQVRSWRRKGWRAFRILEKVRTQPVPRPVPDPSVAVANQMSLLELLDTLPHKQREVIVLRYYEDYSLEEISSALDIPLGTVKSRHHHALRQLRQHWNEADVQEGENDYVY